MCKRRNELIEWVLDNAEIKSILQHKPYTGVRMYVEYEGNLYGADGFSKCRWPDPYNREYGIDLAKRKAAAAIAKRIIEVKNGCQTIASLSMVQASR